MDDDEDMGVRAAFALGLELEFESAGLVAQNHAVCGSSLEIAMGSTRGEALQCFQLLKKLTGNVIIKDNLK